MRKRNCILLRETLLRDGASQMRERERENGTQIATRPYAKNGQGQYPWVKSSSNVQCMVDESEQKRNFSFSFYFLVTFSSKRKDITPSFLCYLLLWLSLVTSTNSVPDFQNFRHRMFLSVCTAWKYALTLFLISCNTPKRPKCRIPDGIITADLIECMYFWMLAIQCLCWLHSLPNTMGSIETFTVFGYNEKFENRQFGCYSNWRVHTQTQTQTQFRSSLRVTKFIKCRPTEMRNCLCKSCDAKWHDFILYRRIKSLFLHRIKEKIKEKAMV